MTELSAYNSDAAIVAMALVVLLAALFLSYRYRTGPINWRMVFLLPLWAFLALLPLMILGFIYQATIEGFRMGRESYHGIMDFLIGAGR